MCTAPLVLNLDTKWNWVVKFMSWPFYSEINSFSLKRRLGWHQESFWSIWRREKRLATAGIQTPACPAQRLVNY